MQEAQWLEGHCKACRMLSQIIRFWFKCHISHFSNTCYDLCWYRLGYDVI